MKIFNKVKGDINEEKAVQYIRKNTKLKIVERNYRNKIGEIDIIAKDDDFIVFVEVKYRTTAMFGYGREAVDDNKIWKIRNVAQLYLKEINRLNAKVRFDVVDILGDTITYIQNAF